MPLSVNNRNRIYDIACGAYDTPLSSNQRVLRFKAVRAFTIPADAAGSAASIGGAPTATTTFNLAKNGSNFGTVAFSTGSVATFTVTQTAFAIDDVLTITGPALADITAGDVGITLKAILT